jgi:hypothetical protein
MPASLPCHAAGTGSLGQRLEVDRVALQQVVARARVERRQEVAQLRLLRLQFQRAPRRLDRRRDVARARGQAGAQRVQLGVLRGERAGAGQRRLGGLQIAAALLEPRQRAVRVRQAGHDLHARAGDVGRRVGLAEPQVASSICPASEPSVGWVPCSASRICQRLLGAPEVHQALGPLARQDRRARVARLHVLDPRQRRPARTRRRPGARPARAR